MKAPRIHTVEHTTLSGEGSLVIEMNMSEGAFVAAMIQKTPVTEARKHKARELARRARVAKNASFLAKYRAIAA
jgi:hypothetical protein